jgi:hypothetical protein
MRLKTEEARHLLFLSGDRQVAFRKKFHPDLETLRFDLDEYVNEYNTRPTHQGKRWQGRTLMKTFLDGKRYFNEKNLDKMRST